MKIWITIRPNKDEIDGLLTEAITPQTEGACKTPLKNMIDQAYALMTLGHEVTLRITTLKYEGREEN